MISRHGKNEFINLLNDLNNIHPRIKFTMDIEENKQFSFLDVLVYEKRKQQLRSNHLYKANSYKAPLEHQL